MVQTIVEEDTPVDMNLNINVKIKYKTRIIQNICRGTFVNGCVPNLANLSETRSSCKYFSTDPMFSYNIITMHVSIAPEPGNPVLRRCTALLSPTQTCFHPAHISTPKGAYNACCHYRRKALLKHIAIASRQVLMFMDE